MSEQPQDNSLNKPAWMRRWHDLHEDFNGEAAPPAAQPAEKAAKKPAAPRKKPAAKTPVEKKPAAKKVAEEKPVEKKPAAPQPEIATAAQERLHSFIRDSDIYGADQLLREGVVPLQKTLALAIEYREYERVLLFIKRGTKPNAAMLDTAVRANDTYLINTLIKHGARATAGTVAYVISNKPDWAPTFIKACDELTPQMLDDATRQKNGQVVTALLGAGVRAQLTTVEFAMSELPGWAPAFIKACDELTPQMLDDAARKKDVKIINALLEAGVAPALETVEFALNEMPQWAPVFIKACDDVTSETLDTAARKRDVKSVGALIDKGVRAELKTLGFVMSEMPQWAPAFIKACDGLTPEMLDAAVRDKDAKIMNAMLETDLKPLPETIRFAIKEIPAWAPALIQKAGTGTAEMLDLAVRAQDANIINTLLKTGVVPLAKTAIYARQIGREDWFAALSKARSDDMVKKMQRPKHG